MKLSRSLKLCAAATLIGVAMPLVASADAISDLQAQIQVLLNQITQMQQSGASSGSASGATTGSQAPTRAAATIAVAACPQLFRTLSIGSSGADVANLQTYLAAGGYFQGEPTGYFGALTQSAVQRFQVAHNVVSGGDAASTGYGVVGAMTRAAISSACSASSPSTPAAPQTPTCNIAPQPTTICSTGWQAQVDQNGCVINYKCSVPLGSTNPSTSACQTGYYLQNGVCVSAVACTAIALVCPAGQSDHVDASCHHSCSPTPSSSSGTLTASPLSGAQPLTVTFGGTAPGGFSIDFGDGTPAQFTGCSGACGSNVTIAMTHTYTTLGTYTAKLMYSGSVIGSVVITTQAQSPSNQSSISVSVSPSSVKQGGAPLTSGDTLNVSWNSYNAPSNAAVVLWLVNTNGTTYGALGQSRPTSGSYAWAVPGPQCDASKTNCVYQTDSINAYYTDPGTYYILAKLYTPQNAYLGGFPPPNPVTPTYAATGQSSTFTIAQATLSCTVIDCAQGYHPSGPSCSATQTCVPN